MRKNLKKIATLAMAAAMAIAVVPAVPTQAAKTELIKNEWDSYFGASSGWAEGAEGAGAHRGPHAGKEPHHESHHGRCRAKGGCDRVLAAGDRYRRSASAGGRGTGAGDLCAVNNKM